MAPFRVHQPVHAFAVDHQSDADAGSDGDVGAGADRPSLVDSVEVLTQRRGIHVCVQGHWHTGIDLTQRAEDVYISPRTFRRRREVPKGWALFVQIQRPKASHP